MIVHDLLGFRVTKYLRSHSVVTLHLNGDGTWLKKIAELIILLDELFYLLDIVWVDILRAAWIFLLDLNHLLFE